MVQRGMAIVMSIRYDREDESSSVSMAVCVKPGMHLLHTTLRLPEPMRVFLPRAPRIATDLGISILLKDEGSGEIVAEAVSGRLCNISADGACIEVVSPLASGYHLFYRTLHTEAFSLLLTGEIAAEPMSSFAVAASSVWMNTTEEEQEPGFRIGVRFRESQPWLFKYFKRL